VCDLISAFILSRKGIKAGGIEIEHALISGKEKARSKVFGARLVERLAGKITA
jgi:hypothetical protein